MENAVADMLKKHPLIAFSPLTDFQVTSLLDVAVEVERLLDAAVISDQSVDGVTLNKGYALLWLWVLGAFEVLRTMAQARICFSEDLAERIVIQKRYLSRLRMPLSKQEFQGKAVASGLTGFLSGVDTKSRDVSFDVGGVSYSARTMLHDFRSLISTVSPTDIKARHDSTYSCRS
ncbi:hypothetical protein M2650_16095 [Luteimonas sp. SX5]|uniref:Uncharacterized protein n=1 Tax=Luteimonas galliterrae TaxID=2940486 RepID=A0ABT0MMP0_9GAMM|nr:hypothetical protein [Luteimonas galliterrae]MCL1636144.1 hypothetical protein [Luteimonas galliterrae]